MGVIDLRYFGSKSSTVEALLPISLAGGTVRTAADAFGGLGTIGAALRTHGVEVTTCDLLRMPHAFQHVRLACGVVPRYSAVRNALGISTPEEFHDYLNNQRMGRSWIVREFSEQRLFFKPENASRIAGVWHKVKQWKEQGLLSKNEECHLIASLINSADACANTAGTYYAHLKRLDRRADKCFNFEFIPISRGVAGKALLGDALQSLSGKTYDLLYLDPPYNGRDYARYYHFPESLASLKRPLTNAESLGGLPAERSEATSKFRGSLNAEYIYSLMSEVEWRRCVVHYCENAIIPLKDLRRKLTDFGSVKEYELAALGYSTRSGARRATHNVFVIENHAG